MQHYHMWFNLIESHRDLEFAANVRAYLDFLQDRHLIRGWTLTRRKFGFGPAELGEWPGDLWMKARSVSPWTWRVARCSPPSSSTRS